MTGQPILVFGDGLQTRDFTYVEDTAAGFIAAAKCDDLTGKTLNIGSHFEISIKDLAEKLNSAMGSPVKIQFVKDRPGDVLRLFAEAAKFQELTGWQPRVSFDTGLQKTIHWFRENVSLEDTEPEKMAFNWE